MVRRSAIGALVCNIAILTTGCSLALDGTGPDGAGDAATQAVDSAAATPPDASRGGVASGEASGGGVQEPMPVADAGDVGVAGDAGVVGAVPETGGESLCAAASAIFCDGFEDGSGAWAPAAASGSVAIDSSRAYRGTHSLHAKTDAVTGTSQPKIGADYTHLFVPSLSFPIFVRMFVFAPAPVQPSVGAFVNVLQSIPPYEGVQLNVRPPGGFLGGTGYNGLDTDWSAASDLVPTDSWSCVELEIDGPPTNLVHVYLWDAELTAMRQALPDDVPPLGLLGIGLDYFAANAQPASDLWIDEVAVDGSRIGCSR